MKKQQSRLQSLILKGDRILSRNDMKSLLGGTDPVCVPEGSACNPVLGINCCPGYICDAFFHVCRYREETDPCDCNNFDDCPGSSTCYAGCDPTGTPYAGACY